MDRKLNLKLVFCICFLLFALSAVSCGKNDGDSANRESDKTDDSGATPECVLGYGMLTDVDIIPDDNMESLLNEMVNFASDVRNAQTLINQDLYVSERDMNSYLAKLWIKNRSFDCDMNFNCYRIKDANTLERYSVWATTSRPSDSDFVITNSMDWFEVMDGKEHKQMQTNINGVSVYFYKKNKTTKTVKYNIYPLDNGGGYYIYADDMYGYHQVCFEWWNRSSHWSCVRFEF